MTPTLQIAFLAALGALAVGAMAKPIEGGLSRIRHARRKAWWRRRRLIEHEAFARQKARRKG